MATIDNITNTMNTAAQLSTAASSNVNSISSFDSSTPQTFVSNITSTATSAVKDPISAVLNKTLGQIAQTSTITQKKINDLSDQLLSYVDKNSNVTIHGNQIVITINKNQAAQGQIERNNIQNKIESIRNTLNIMQKTMGSLQTISQTIQVIQTLLNIQETLIAVNPIAKVAFTVFKAAIKVVFLRDMLNGYSSVITSQLASNQVLFNQMLQKFMNLQVSLNIQDNLDQGNTINVDDALNNISQNLLGQGTDSPTTINNTSDDFIGSNARVYTLRVDKFGTGQLIGTAIDKITGLKAVQTAPSFIESPDQLVAELKTILSGQ
jgi:hypothetical protein